MQKHICPQFLSTIQFSSSRFEVVCKKVVLKNFAEKKKKKYVAASRLGIKKDKVVSYKFSEVLKNTFLVEHLQNAFS